uniref:Uncharacterized protein n=1 Tax=Schizaphis graminum TaxID=13262 RepID=A0A2S2NN13_SCHGA
MRIYLTYFPWEEQFFFSPGRKMSKCGTGIAASHDKERKLFNHSAYSSAEAYSGSGCGGPVNSQKTLNASGLRFLTDQPHASAQSNVPELAPEVDTFYSMYK